MLIFVAVLVVLFAWFLVSVASTDKVQKAAAVHFSNKETKEYYERRFDSELAYIECASIKAAQLKIEGDVQGAARAASQLAERRAALVAAAEAFDNDPYELGLFRAYDSIVARYHGWSK